MDKTAEGSVILGTALRPSATKVLLSGQRRAGVVLAQEKTIEDAHLRAKAAVQKIQWFNLKPR